jgi:hypothetical protein
MRMRPFLLGVFLAGADEVSHWATLRQRAPVLDVLHNIFTYILLYKFYILLSWIYNWNSRVGVLMDAKNNGT